MPTAFTPPGFKSLARIDIADVKYRKEPVVIHGVVSPESQGGWDGRNDSYAVFCFTLAAWQKLGEPPVERKLTVLCPTRPRAKWWGKFPEFSIHRFHVLLTTDETRAVFKKSLPVEGPHRELKAIAKRLQKPVRFRSTTFDLWLNRETDTFGDEVEWNGDRVDLSLSADGERPAENALRMAEALWGKQKLWNGRIEKYAAQELLKLKNGNWLGEDESPLTAKQFTAKMTLQSISVDGRGYFEFWYDDGDMFLSHAIMVRGNFKDGPVNAGIHG